MTTEAGEGGGEKFATLRQARLAIEELSDSDYVKLMLIARGFARIRLRGNYLEPDDLLHDAILKTLEGRRRWNRQVTIVQHLDRVMESDSGHEAERRRTRGFDPLPEKEAESARQESPENRVLILDELREALADFADDRMAVDLLHLKAWGYSASEIQRELGIDDRQYDTTTKRIRRRIAKHLSQGPG